MTIKTVKDADIQNIKIPDDVAGYDDLLRFYLERGDYYVVKFLGDDLKRSIQEQNNLSDDVKNTFTAGIEKLVNTSRKRKAAEFVRQELYGLKKSAMVGDYEGAFNHSKLLVDICNHYGMDERFRSAVQSKAGTYFETAKKKNAARIIRPFMRFASISAGIGNDHDVGVYVDLALEAAKDFDMPQRYVDSLERKTDYLNGLAAVMKPVVNNGSR